MAALVAWFAAHPEAVVLGWPLVSGLASFGYHKVEHRFPQLVAALRASGVDFPAILRAVVAAFTRRRVTLPPAP